MLKLFLFILISGLELLGCTATSASKDVQAASGQSGNSVVSPTYLTPAQDPDGDGDAKGYYDFPIERPATGKRVFVFDPKKGIWAAYNEKGQRINVGRASGGKMYCPDIKRSCKTIVGQFAILRKGGKDCRSSRYPVKTGGGAPMPYCMYFSSMGYAVHGSTDVPDQNASHGCVRITPKAAQWLSANFMQVGTVVIVLPYL